MSGAPGPDIRWANRRRARGLAPSGVKDVRQTSRRGHEWSIRNPCRVIAAARSSRTCARAAMFRSRHSSPLVAQTGTKGEKMTGPGQLELLDPGVETDAPHSAWSGATRQVVRLFGLPFATLPGDRVRGPGIPDPPAPARGHFVPRGAVGVLANAPVKPGFRGSVPVENLAGVKNPTGATMPGSCAMALPNSTAPSCPGCECSLTHGALDGPASELTGRDVAPTAWRAQPHVLPPQVEPAPFRDLARPSAGAQRTVSVQANDYAAPAVGTSGVLPDFPRTALS